MYTETCVFKKDVKNNSTVKGATVDSIIVRALEIILVKKLMPTTVL